MHLYKVNDLIILFNLFQLYELEILFSLNFDLKHYNDQLKGHLIFSKINLLFLHKMYIIYLNK